MAGTEPKVQAGVRSLGPVLPEPLASEVAHRSAVWARRFQPRTEFESWLIQQMAVASIRIDTCAARLAWREVERINRARLAWDEDRLCEVTELGSNLPDHPAETAARLQQSSRGCRWLILRWQGLAAAAETTGGWNVRQRILAFDLLGVPHAIRSGHPRLPVDLHAAELVVLARSEIDRLTKLAERLEPLDEAHRNRVLNRLDVDRSPVARLLRRDMADAHRVFDWAYSLLRASPSPQDGAGATAGAPPFEPQPTPSPVPTLGAGQARRTAVPRAGNPFPSDLPSQRGSGPVSMMGGDHGRYRRPALDLWRVRPIPDRLEPHADPRLPGFVSNQPRRVENGKARSDRHPSSGACRKWNNDP